MYPFVRLIKEVIRNRNAPPLGPLDIHVSWHRCWPQDLDIYMEMNNGRIPTIMELSRIGLAQRVGLIRVLRQNGWGLAVAGSSIRYRKRIKLFNRFQSLSRLIGWDDKFFYMENSIWLGKDCAAQALFRTAVTDRNGIVKTALVMEKLGHMIEAPDFPLWVQTWIDADATRPWPPEHRPA